MRSHPRRNGESKRGTMRDTGKNTMANPNHII